MKGISSADNIVRPVLLQRYHDEPVFQQPWALKALPCQPLHKRHHSLNTGCDCGEVHPILIKDALKKSNHTFHRRYTDSNNLKLWRLWLHKRRVRPIKHAAYMHQVSREQLLRRELSFASHCLRPLPMKQERQV